MKKDLVLYRLQSWKHIKLLFSDKSIIITDYNVSETDANNSVGYCDILENFLIAIFSYSKKNYLYLGDKLVELTKEISIEQYVAQDRGIKSWFKIYDNGEKIFELEYINPHEPFVLPDPFAYYEDFNTTNFAYSLANYIQKVKNNPNIVLFRAAEATDTTL